MKYNMVKLINLVKMYDGTDLAVENVSLDIYEGEFLTLLGPSGCGKTTTLRMIAGFEDIDSGEIYIDNVDVSDIPPYKRNVNTVFQNYALFPHMSVYDNIAFGLRLKKISENEIEKKIDQILEMVQMNKFKNKMPNQISGGQKQRVAIARAIINNPKVLLLDEPLAALDYKLRKKMQMELKDLQKELGITFIYVTHDQEEALTMSDRICVMNNGIIEQVATPYEIYERPATKFVANFIGESNIFDAEIESIENNICKCKFEDGHVEEKFEEIQNDMETYQAENTNEDEDEDEFFEEIEEDIITDYEIEENKIYKKLLNVKVGEDVYFMVRPEKMYLRNDVKGFDNFIQVEFYEQIYVGSSNKIAVLTKGGMRIVVSENTVNVRQRDEKKKLYVCWKSEHMVRIEV